MLPNVGVSQGTGNELFLLKQGVTARTASFELIFYVIIRHFYIQAKIYQSYPMTHYNCQSRRVLA